MMGAKRGNEMHLGHTYNQVGRYHWFFQASAGEYELTAAELVKDFWSAAIVFIILMVYSIIKKHSPAHILYSQ